MSYKNPQVFQNILQRTKKREIKEVIYLNTDITEHW